MFRKLCGQRTMRRLIERRGQRRLVLLLMLRLWGRRRRCRLCLRFVLLVRRIRSILRLVRSPVERG